MRQYIVYKCDYCDFESKSFAETEKHEAEHFGLTVDEFHRWNTLKAEVKSYGEIISRTKNEKTEKMFDDAIEKLIVFEKAHGIKNN